LARAAFLIVWFIALLGTAWPVVLALHRRFHDEPAAWTVWRQSAWVAAWGTASAWLQMNRWFNVALAVIIASVFILIELLWSMHVARQEVQDD